MYLKLLRGILVGTEWRAAGTVIQSDGRHAEQLVRSNAAVPVPAPVEAAIADAPAAAQQAVRKAAR